MKIISKENVLLVCLSAMLQLPLYTACVNSGVEFTTACLVSLVYGVIGITICLKFSDIKK